MKQLVFVTRRPDATSKFAQGAILPVWGGPHDGAKVHFAPQDEATAILVGEDPHVVAFRSFFNHMDEKPFKTDWVLVPAPELKDDGEGGGWRP